MAWSLEFLLLLAAALPLQGQSDSRFAGASACAKCHAAIHQEWSASRHANMLRGATQQAIQGDFAISTTTLGGSPYLFRHNAAGYFITESALTGKPWEHRVDYTLGGRRVQHYLSTLPDGRMLIIPATWDVLRKKWTLDVDIGNPEEAPGGQVWNKSCYGCHVSREEKNFDLEHLAYRTTWADTHIDCETCHGPGRAHASNPQKTSQLVNPARLGAASATMVCAQCHSVRDIYADGFTAGGDYYDSFMPVMEYRLPASDDPAFWTDGRPRWFANEAIALWQSRCFLKGGANCETCHARSHSLDSDPRLRSGNDALCSKCHASIASNVMAHSHHAPKSAGSSCIGCHMPAIVTSLHTSIRDHSISIPAPVNTIAHGIPNACSLCHRDQDAAWADKQMAGWYGAGAGKRLAVRAAAFAAARKGDPAAISPLRAILADSSEGSWIRANAVGYLGTFPDDPDAFDAVLHAFTDREPLVRAIAASAIRPRAAQRETVVPLLLPLLHDPLRTVRMSAAISMVSMGVQRFEGPGAEDYERAKALYHARAELNSDDAPQQFAAGKFFFLAGDMANSTTSLQAALKLDPGIPAHYLLARALNEKGDFAAARAVLVTIPREDPDYNTSRLLLAEIDKRLAASPNSPDAEARFLNAQVQYQSQYYAAALKNLDEALRLAPDAQWATKARIYRAVCLEKTARTAEAEAAMQALAAQPVAAQDVDLQLAYVELFFETGRADAALQRLDALIANVPNAPMAHFWRAKVLLQLHRPSAALEAAEESIRLSPDLSSAHNLLIRIYQTLGRAKDAAREAAWMRNHEKR